LRSRGTIKDVGGEQAIEELTIESTGVGSLPQMCDLVAALGRRRRRVAAANTLAVAAVVDDDPDAWDSALAVLHEADGPSRSKGGWASPHDIADRLINNLQGSDPVRWPWPLHRLNHLSGGGARRGQMTFIGGASSHGKSAFVDCALQSMAQRRREHRPVPERDDRRGTRRADRREPRERALQPHPEGVGRR
jgi:replicative DNA helicase